jgi:hypothetical protein
MYIVAIETTTPIKFTMSIELISSRIAYLHHKLQFVIVIRHGSIDELAMVNG